MVTKNEKEKSAPKAKEAKLKERVKEMKELKARLDTFGFSEREVYRILSRHFDGRSESSLRYWLDSSYRDKKKNYIKQRIKSDTGFRKHSFQRSNTYNRTRRNLWKFLPNVLKIDEVVSLDELAERLEKLVNISFQPRTLIKVNEEFREKYSISPLEHVCSECKYRLNQEFYQEV